MIRPKTQSLDAYIRIRAPAALFTLVERCAAKQMMTTSAFARAALVAALARHGVAPPRLGPNKKRSDVIGKRERQEIEALCEAASS
jgi:hypothetical protein